MANEPSTTNGSAIGNTKANPVVQLIRADKMQAMVQERLGKRAGQFTTSLISLVNANPKIAECTPITVIQAALTAASMDLPINQNLGVAYIVPYKNNKLVYNPDTKRKEWETTMEAQFQMGWKGFVQLAQRSGQFKTINTTEVREGEVKTRDRMTGELKFDWCDDDEKRKKLEVVGYLAYFELLNGFSKSLYMTKSEVDAHATRYSQAYKGAQGNTNQSKFKTPWQTDFDLMAQKTVLKLLLSKFAPLSTEMQEAVQADQSVADENGRHYVDYGDESDIEDVKADDEKKQAIIDAHKKTASAKEAEVIDPPEEDVDEKIHEVATRPDKEEKKETVAEKAARKYGPKKQASLIDDKDQSDPGKG